MDSEWLKSMTSCSRFCIVKHICTDQRPWKLWHQAHFLINFFRCLRNNYSDSKHTYSQDKPSFDRVVVEYSLNKVETSEPHCPFATKREWYPIWKTCPGIKKDNTQNLHPHQKIYKRHAENCKLLIKRKEFKFIAHSQPCNSSGYTRSAYWTQIAQSDHRQQHFLAWSIYQ